MWSQNLTKKKPASEMADKPKDEVKDEPKEKVEPGHEVNAEAKPEIKEETKIETKEEPEIEATAEMPPSLTPEIVTRVHKLYEELGREEVKAVQEWEETQKEISAAKNGAEQKPKDE